MEEFKIPTRDEFIQAIETRVKRTEVVPIPELRIAVEIEEIDFGQQCECERMATVVDKATKKDKVDSEKNMQFTLLAGLKRPKLTPADAEKFKKLSLGQVKKLSDKILELSGLEVNQQPPAETSKEGTGEGMTDRGFSPPPETASRAKAPGADA